MDVSRFLQGRLVIASVALGRELRYADHYVCFLARVHGAIVRARAPSEGAARTAPSALVNRHEGAIELKDDETARGGVPVLMLDLGEISESLIDCITYLRRQFLGWFP